MFSCLCLSFLTHRLGETNELALSLTGSTHDRRTLSERIAKGEFQSNDYLNDLAAEALKLLRRDTPSIAGSPPHDEDHTVMYATYPTDYPFPEAIEAAARLSAAKRDIAVEETDSFPWIETRSPDHVEESNAPGDSFPWIEQRSEDQSGRTAEEVDDFPWIQARSLDESTELADNPDSFPWIEGRSANQVDDTSASADSFPWIQSRDQDASSPQEFPDKNDESWVNRRNSQRGRCGIGFLVSYLPLSGKP